MPHNVLLIVVDDLRPNIAAHGSAFMVTPQMDALAASGVLFQRAYAQYSLCGPSRTSFLSGRRPDATRAWSFQNHFREGVGADWTSLPEHFRRNGYRTLAAGKLFDLDAAAPDVNLAGVARHEATRKALSVWCTAFNSR